jgi:hypothetical protein
MTGPGYQVTITMSATTVEMLSLNGSLLYTFKAVRNSSKAGRPLVWSSSDQYSTITRIGWDGLYSAYTSSQPIVPGSLIQPGFSHEIAPGQTLQVRGQGIGEVVSGGPSAAISFANTTTAAFTVGIAESQGAASTAPYCAFPLFGLHLETIVPTAKVLLMFSTDSIAPGTVIDGSLGAAAGGAAISAGAFETATFVAISAGLLIDLASASQAQVSFDINTGWVSKAVPSLPVAAGADLVPLLIET